MIFLYLSKSIAMLTIFFTSHIFYILANNFQVKTLLLLYITNLFLNRHFPDEMADIRDDIVEKMNKTMTNVGYNFVYMYSFIQIQWNKLTNVICSIKSLFYTNSLSILINYYDNSGKILDIEEVFLSSIENYNCYDLSVINSRIRKNNDCFTIIAVPTNQTNHVNFVCLDKGLNDEPLSTYEETKFTFMSILITTNETTYTVKLKDNTFNYYIVGNSLSRNFIKYYLGAITQKYYGPDEKFEYVLNIIDHNINVISINQDQKLIFDKTSYTIVDEKEKESIENSGDSSDSDETTKFVKIRECDLQS